MPPHQPQQQLRGFHPGMRMGMPGQHPMARPQMPERPINPMASEDR